MKNIKAFTLAEVLITLGIIGVIAALTIPTLMQQQQSAATVSALKKAYSTLSNAHKAAIAENGSPEGWGTTNTDFFNTLISQMKILKNCGTSTGCSSTNYNNYFGSGSWDPETDPNTTKAILADGSTIMFTGGSTCNGSTSASGMTIQDICGNIYIDIDGNKGANRFDKDLFVFYLTKDGPKPKGIEYENFGETDGECLASNINIGSAGTCTAWVLYNGNMNYPNTAPPPINN